MANHTTVLTITSEDEQVPNRAAFSLDGQRALRDTAAYLEALAAGHRVGSVVAAVDSGNAVAASGTFTFSSASGTTTATINGVVFSQTTGNDSARATALAAAVSASANALISGLVTASAALGVVTITASRKGAEGNAFTLAASGTGLTASGNRLTGGTNDSTTVTITR